MEPMSRKTAADQLGLSVYMVQKLIRYGDLKTLHAKRGKADWNAIDGGSVSHWKKLNADRTSTLCKKIIDWYEQGHSLEWIESSMKLALDRNHAPILRRSTYEFMYQVIYDHVPKIGGLEG